MSKTIFLFAVLCCLFAGAALTAEDPKPKELGNVDWKRDYEAAKKISAKTGKPLLLLFQEVPG